MILLEEVTRRLLLLSAVVLACIAALATTGSTSGDEIVGRPAPTFTLPDVNGAPFSLATTKGKIVVLEFWATWCPPCRVQMRLLGDLAEKYKDKNVVYLRVNARETPEQVRSFLQQNANKYFPTLLTFADDSVLEAYHVGTYPTVVVIDPNGIVARVEKAEPELEAVLRHDFARMVQPDYRSPISLATGKMTFPGVVYPEPEPVPPPIVPESPEGFLLRAQRENRMRQFKAALDDIDGALSSRPNWSAALRLRASVHAAQYKYDAAVSDCSEALSSAPEDWLTYQVRAGYYEQLGKRAEAIQDYSLVIKKNPNTAFAYLRRGSLYLGEHEWEKAKADFDRAVELSPTDVAVYRNRARVYDHMSRWEEELADLDKVLLAVPTDAAAKQQRVDVYRRLAHDPRREAQDDTYAVYSTVLLHAVWNHNDDSKMLFIREKTGTTYGGSAPEKCLAVPAAYKEQFAEVLAEYKAHGQQELQLEPRFVIPRPYKLMSAEEAKHFVAWRFEGKQPPAASAALFKQTPDLIRLGRVFFNHDHTLALVLVSNWCGGLCGGERWRILEKRRGAWMDLDWVRCMTMS